VIDICDTLQTGRLEEKVKQSNSLANWLGKESKHVSNYVHVKVISAIGLSTIVYQCSGRARGVRAVGRVCDLIMLYPYGLSGGTPYQPGLAV
jgi:hypothetical protein